MLTLLLLTLTLASPVEAEPFLMLASSPATRDSGLFDSILPKLEGDTGISVRLVPVQPGQALEFGRRGAVDALLVHDRPEQDRLLSEGHALFRRDVMYHDLVIVGPSADPAGIHGMASASAALARIAAQQAPFVSRGDDSGTHEAERRLWAAVAIDPCSAPGTWYREASASMAGTLHLAARLSAYTLADRASWLGLEERGDLAVLIEGDPGLRKAHALLVVNPERHPHVKADLATRFADWLTGEAGQRAIASFAVGGKPVFFPLPPAETRLSPPARP